MGYVFVFRFAYFYNFLKMVDVAKKNRKLFFDDLPQKTTIFLFALY